MCWYILDTPTLLKIMTMKGTDGKPMNIVKRIAAHDYKTFGMLLLKDENGEEVDIFRKYHMQDGPESVIMAILKKWLISDTTPEKWQHLIECLKQCQLNTLAEEIAYTTGNHIIIQIHCITMTWWGEPLKHTVVACLCVCLCL